MRFKESAPVRARARAKSRPTSCGRCGATVTTRGRVRQPSQAAVHRPLDEYCEWHVVRDPDTNKIVRVTFTSEPPEYWEGCSGTLADPVDGTPFPIPGDRDRVPWSLRTYRSSVQMDDLICQETIQAPNGSVYAQQGQYNP